MFVDREFELDMLDEVWSRGVPSLVVIYGRRRVGKTALARVFLEGRGGLYVIVNYEDVDAALRDLEDQVSEVMGYRVSFPKLRDFIKFVSTYLCKVGGVVVIDEFQRLTKSGIATLIQEFWDTEISKCGRRALLILLGSSVGVVEGLARSYGGPLFGRVGRCIHLKPFTYRVARVFMGGFSEVDRVRLYAIFGGTPHYLRLIDSNLSVKDNVRRNILEPTAPLREEPYFLISTETRDPDRYLAILTAIANGASRISEISSKTGIPVTSLSKYLGVLERTLGIIERVEPLLGGRGIYRIKDNFFRFWFRFVNPSRRLLELGLIDEVLDKVMRGLDSYVATTWEDIALEHFTLLRREGVVRFTDIGRWWFKGVEIDLVAIDEEGNDAYFIEVKWGTLSNREVKEIGKELMMKARKFPWRRTTRKEHYVIYAKDIKGSITINDVTIYTLKDVANLMDKHKPRIIKTNSN